MSGYVVSHGLHGPAEILGFQKIPILPPALKHTEMQNSCFNHHLPVVKKNPNVISSSLQVNSKAEKSNEHASIMLKSFHLLSFFCTERIEWYGFFFSILN